jgi:phosphoglucosamine mutase
VVFGQDTRESSGWISSVLGQGLQDSKVAVVSAGVITTPGVAYLTRANQVSVGIVISASHNPWQDNGIKIFGADGYKLSDELEHAIEADIFAHLEQLTGRASLDALDGSGMLPGDVALREQYAGWLAALIATKELAKLRVLVDCANGAAGSVAPLVFRDAGIAADFLNIAPDGRNINAGCGALHPEHVANAVANSNGKYDLGITFDGDADRALFVSGSGKIVDGDAVLYLAGTALKREGRLPGDLVVATVMSNLGLEKALAEEGITMLRTPVGDKYVLEEMLRRGAVLGGEQSGHVIFTQYATTGDGLLTALRVLEIVRDSGRSLDELSDAVKTFPQKLVNVRVKYKRPLKELDSVQAEIAAAEQEFQNGARVVVRFSGTEPLARVMIEAESVDAVEKWTARIADAIRAELGAAS